MNKISFICGTLLIGIISANLKPVHSLESSDNNPSLSCILFEDFGCGVQCTFMAKVQNSPQTSASCNDEQKCTCTVESNESLDTLWYKKFNADDVLRQIKQNRELAKKVTQVLKNTSRTGMQSKQDLKEILPKRLYRKIRVRPYTSNTTKINQTKLDVESIKKLVSKQEVKSVMLNLPMFDTTDLQFLNWMENFYAYLGDNKENASIQSVYHQVGLTGNVDLKEYLDYFLDEDDAPEIDTTIKYEQDDAVPQIVANMVVDGMIRGYSDLNIFHMFL
ncbi:uncharacterized protein LOC135845390 [Planococcus citri]|uniref:uncharacterized protein LOC135845390 n=1 Tax=Planococcus citri TaxID=170843 RepID=UPI0031F8BF51